MDENIFPTVPLPTLDADVENIRKLDDEPNDVGGLTAAQLKEEFDKGNVTIKKWINENFIPALQSAEGASGIGAKDGESAQSDVQTELDKLRKDSHIHENKTLLDTYTQTEEALSAAVLDRHTHENKTVLDGIKEVSQTLGNSSEKVPSERAVSEALVLAGGIPGGGLAQQVLKKRSDTSFDLEWANDAVMVVDLGTQVLDVPFSITENQYSALFSESAPVAKITIDAETIECRRYSVSSGVANYSGSLPGGSSLSYIIVSVNGMQVTASATNNPYGITAEIAGTYDKEQIINDDVCEALGIPTSSEPKDAFLAGVSYTKRQIMQNKETTFQQLITGRLI